MRRVVDLSATRSEDVFRIRLDRDCLCVSHGVEEHPDEVRIPAHEIATLILGPRVAATGAVLGAIAASGGAVLVLDDRFQPSGLLLPVAGHHAHAARLRSQIGETGGVAPRLWQQVVRAKIVAQALVLADVAQLHGITSAAGATAWDASRALAALQQRVEPGDPQNVEAVAAKSYWHALMGDGFVRHADDDANRKLNYGYAVLRSVVARAACAAGLHPALGLHHSSGRNAFALADDLMEPARPMVDRAVARLRGPLDRSAKRALVSVLVEPVDMPQGRYALVDAYALAAQSLVDVLSGDKLLLDLPVLF